MFPTVGPIAYCSLILLGRNRIQSARLVYNRIRQIKAPHFIVDLNFLVFNNQNEFQTFPPIRQEMLLDLVQSLDSRQITMETEIEIY